MTAKKKPYETIVDIIVEDDAKQQAAIHNKKAHDLGVKWGKEVQKRNGADMKNLRIAIDIIEDIRDIADVVDAYREAGGDPATASKIKKILTVSYSDPAARAVVFDESSNSLQGCYTKIRDIEKGTEQINDGEGDIVGEVAGAAEHSTIEVPAGVDVAAYVEQLHDMIEVLSGFDKKGANLLKKAVEHMASYETVHAKPVATPEAWNFPKSPVDLMADIHA